jgi:hypothetical protein
LGPQILNASQIVDIAVFKFQICKTTKYVEPYCVMHVSIAAYLLILEKIVLIKIPLLFFKSLNYIILYFQIGYFEQKVLNKIQMWRFVKQQNILCQQILS